MTAPDPGNFSQWAIREWVERFRQSGEAMSGEALRAEKSEGATAAGQGDLHWSQPFTAGPGAELRIIAPHTSWLTLGAKVLAAAGIDDAAQDECRATFLEILQQSLSGVATSLGGLFGREVSCGTGQAMDQIPEGETVHWVRFETAGGADLGTIGIQISRALRVLMEPVEPGGEGEPGDGVANATGGEADGSAEEGGRGSAAGGERGSAEGGGLGSAEGGGLGSAAGGGLGSAEGGGLGSTEGGGLGSTAGGGRGSTEGGGLGSAAGGERGSTEGGESGAGRGTRKHSGGGSPGGMTERADSGTANIPRSDSAKPGGFQQGAGSGGVETEGDRDRQRIGRTMELLYDVELPVAVSFGRAHLPLKEVVKLTSGSIVELNRAVAEPVELIVNNCVIARAEVVVVDGNYGVRIIEIVSQRERLRTLH